MKTLLVPTDFSDGSKSAVNTAIALAKKGNAQIHFLHVLSTPVDWLRLDKSQEKNYPETIKEIGIATDKLNKLVKKANEAGVEAKEILNFNIGVSDLCHYIEQHNYDLVLIGSHGISDLSDMMLGSNAQRVLRNAKVPLLVLKAKSKSEFNKLLFASNFEEEAKHAFKKALDFAKLNNAEVHLLFVNVPYHFEDTATTMARMKKFEKLGDGLVKGKHIYNAHGEEKGILAFSDENKIDVIALTTHGKSGFMRMLAPSIAESLANHSGVPVLSINVKSK
ncbi:MAG: universal stress protein [Bacteroidia bacterium]|nr:universal stress protein [Bacteroidia bacterium]